MHNWHQNPNIATTPTESGSSAQRISTHSDDALLRTRNDFMENTKDGNNEVYQCKQTN